MTDTLKNILKILILVVISILTVYLLPRYDSHFHYHAEVGRPWGYDLVTAGLDIPIYKTEQQLALEQEELLRDFAPCFVYDTLASSDNTSLYVISGTDMDWLAGQQVSRIAVLKGKVSMVYPLAQIYTPKTAYMVLGIDVAPNLRYDTLTTARLKDELLSQISPTQGIIQKGEKIIDRGEIVTEYHLQMLNSLQRAVDDQQLSGKKRLWRIGGEAFLVGIYLILFAFYLIVFRRKYYNDLNTLLFFALLSTIIIIAACLLLHYSYTYSLYLIPFTWVPIITRVFYDARTALFLHIITILIVSLAVPVPFEFLLMQLAAGMVAVVSLKDMTRRAQLAQTAAWIFITYSVSYTAVNLATVGDLSSLHWQVYVFLAGNAILVVCAYGLIYIFERIFRLMSSITLVELTDINSTVLHDLAERAPGTFQHSMQVSNLATEAAKAIGANALLVRTAALYHDIGKLANPEYFTENQHDNFNPLSSLDPAEAAKIIIAHVKNGEKLARKNNLPESIIHFIVTHHGTSLARYFYNTAVNKYGQVDMALYQYPGPKPSTREDAILMMADAVEARSRSLATYTEESISQAVTMMIQQQIDDEQFIDTPLSFKDVATIRRIFIERLLAIHHHRIQYPDINK